MNELSPARAPAAAPPRIAIIGGGFSGAVTAVQLVRKATGPLDITIIEPREMLGGGVAYSAADPAHRINVPASRMTVFAEDPCQFDRWMRMSATLKGDPAAQWSDGSAFPQRGVFGRYVAGLVADATREKPDVTIRHEQSAAASMTAHATGFTVTLETGKAMRVDLVVLAVSHPPPAVPGALRGIQAAGAPVIANPWRAGALDAIPADARVLIVGTGLTMADVVATLDRRGHRGPILAVSRRGLLSRGHAFGAVAKRNWFETSPPCRTALRLCRAVRAQVGAAAADGEPWQAVFDDVRGNARRLWSVLNTAERRRLVRHLRPYWDVHRFRVSPQAEAAIAGLREKGQFESVAASLLGATWDGNRVQVRLRPRRSSDVMAVDVDAVVVTTGPAHGSAIATNPALASLAEAGLVQADAAGLGLDVDPMNRAIGTNGVARRDLLVAGPLARGQVGELMGLPQVSDHAAAVAETALATLPMALRERPADAANDAAHTIAAAAYQPL